MMEPEKSDDAAGDDSGNKSGGMLKNVAQAEQMVQLAIALPAGCLVGWLLGSWGDRAWHQNWIGLTGLLLGAVGGFLQIYRVAAGYLKNNK